MLKEKYNEDAIGALICEYDEFHPFPRGDERQHIAGLPGCLRNKWIVAGEQYIDFSWPVIPAVRFMDFKRNGNRSEFEKLHFKRREVSGSACLNCHLRLLSQR